MAISYDGWYYTWWCIGSTLIIFLPSYFIFDVLLERLAKRHAKLVSKALSNPNLAVTLNNSNNHTNGYTNGCNHNNHNTLTTSGRSRSNSITDEKSLWIIDNCQDSKARAMVVHKIVNLVYHTITVVLAPFLEFYDYDWWVPFLALEFASDITDVIYQTLVLPEGMKRDLLLHHVIVLSGGPIGVYYHMDGRVVLFCSSFCTMAMHFGWVLTKTPSIYRSAEYGYYLILQTIIFAICRGIITPYQIYHLYWQPSKWVQDFPFFTYLSGLSFVFCLLNWLWLWRITNLGQSWFKQQQIQQPTRGRSNSLSKSH